MLLETMAPPRTVEGRLLRLIMPDSLLLFLILSAIGNGALFYSDIVPFPQILLLVPAALILAVVITFLRFYGYLANVIRTMGVLSHVYDELGGGTSSIKIDFPKPLLLFGFLFKKEFASSPTKQFTFSMKTDSAKYKSEILVVVDKAGYSFDISLVDWRNQKHSRSARGKMPQLQNASNQMLSEMRVEVLESKGVSLATIAPPVENYVPAPKIVPSIVPKPIVISKPIVSRPTPRKAIPLTRVIDHPTKKKAIVPKPKAVIPRPIVQKPKTIVPKPKTLVPKPVMALPEKLDADSLQKKAEEVKAKIKGTKKKEEKDALQDVLFQIEEIDKVIKEN